MTTMKENIPISQKVDDVADSSSKISDNERPMDPVAAPTSSKKRATFDESQASTISSQEEKNESIDPVSTDAKILDADASMHPVENIDSGEPIGASAVPSIDLQRPVKRARSAYFLFLEDHRNETQKEHPGEGVGSIARILGQRWSELTEAEKQPYHAKAVLEKERVAAETEMWKQAARAAGHDPSIDALIKGPSNHSDSTSNGGGFTLPLARVRKICRLDPEVRGISKEALVMITKATEMFAVRLGQECVKTAHIQNRRTLLPQDVVDVCQIRECFQFLKDDMQDLHRHQQQVSAEAKASHPAATKGKGNRAVTAIATKPLTDYFKPAV